MTNGSLVPVTKRSKTDLVAINDEAPRTSNLLSPIMLLMGHEGEIYAAKFTPDGSLLASAGFDRKIMLWNTYGECENFAILSGHTGAVMDLHFSTDSSLLFTCSTDQTVRIWDMETGACLRKFKGHGSFVNACHPNRRGPQLVCSAGDDGTVRVWDRRQRDACRQYQSTYQVTSVSFNDTGDQLFSAGIDNHIKAWDMRKDDCIYSMNGHSDTVTGLSLSPDGSFLLSNSMDCTVRIWDIRPFAPEQRCQRIFQGSQHNFEKNLLRCCWSPDNNRISAGSSDRYVYIWDVATCRILYKLPGHQGSVNETDFHPIEPIIMSAGSDKKIYLGELA